MLDIKQNTNKPTLLLMFQLFAQLTHHHPMDIPAALSLIRVAAESRDRYNDHMRKSLVTAIFELADSCQTPMGKPDRDSEYLKGWNDLESIKLAAESALQNGSFHVDMDRIARYSLTAAEFPADIS